MTEKDSNWEVVIDGNIVSKKALIYAYRFYRKYHLIGGESTCPLCGCDLHDNGLFCCNDCAEILPIEDKCEIHNTDVCKDCCPQCKEERMYWDSINSEIDKRRGK